MQELLRCDHGCLRSHSQRSRSSSRRQQTYRTHREGANSEGLSRAIRNVLNRPDIICDAASDRLPQVETKANLGLPPSLHKTITASKQLSSEKAPESDAIPVEVYRHGCPQLMDHLTAFLQNMNAIIVHLYKQKGNRQLCDNQRGISPLNIIEKIFACVLPNSFKSHLEEGLLSENRCGFRGHHGTTDIIFPAFQLQEKRQKMRIHLYSTFVDLKEPFDTVNYKGLWKIMQKSSCPKRFTHMVRQLQDGMMMTRVTDDGTISEALAKTKGMKEACVLAPTLFGLMFISMLMDVYRDERPGIHSL
nr:unnamed protein product [Spirometra erinaceieuropaei]